MQRVAASGAIAALAYQAAAAAVAAPTEVELSFVDQTWDDVTVGDSWPIKWSAGNGEKVKLSVHNATWEYDICEEESAPGHYNWEVDVPECGATYTFEVKQDDCETLESPEFTVKCKEGETEWTDGKWADNGEEKPSNIIVVYYEEECSCTKSKETAAPTHSSAAWYDDELKCTVTSEGPVPTGWADHSVSASSSASVSKGWADHAAPATTGTDPGHTWSDASVAPTTASSGANWVDASKAPAATTGTDPAHTWADAPVAPATATSGANWVDASAKPVAPAAVTPGKVANYTGAATQLTASFGALAAIFLAALAL